ncbi:hypothetical protein AGRA3207_007510 [Actinomadura graeca]|uniref:Uncharacterized protein n=1 Tax=Actinomadura graeca TaxID=2750812 RepID=A0ABX8R4D3_9ACTN|nr:hypothetical protein [Actinomadura graeca]QXJ25941.1 hypothetical protein AGRA3207_007510 [Actinomadura graeca]
MSGGRAGSLPGRRVRVHFNLINHCFAVVSVAGPDRGRVIRYATDVTCTSVRFHVSPSGRAKVQRTGRRNVHAWCTGVVEAIDTGPDLTALRRVTYNPHRGATFYLCQELTAVLYADRVVFAKTAPSAQHGYAWVSPQESARPAHPAPAPVPGTGQQARLW